MNSSRHHHDYMGHDETLRSNEKKILWVVWLTLVTMIFEILFGYLTGSMALLADGWHMGSHVGALGISWLAYRMARSESIQKHFTFGTGKFVPLAGYTSALLLAVVAILMVIESLQRLLTPKSIQFEVAIGVAVVGLLVNLLSAFILKEDHHHDHDHHHTHDHNHESAFMHVLADALTSVLAIIALVLGRYFSWNWADPLMGIVGALVILRWGYTLCKKTAWELLDGHAKDIPIKKIENVITSIKGVSISDLHIWKVAPNAHACELVVNTSQLRGAEFYRELILKEMKIEHLVIEEKILYLNMK